MEQGILQTAGAVAGIGGVALLVFLWIFREVIRKNVFPKMSADHGYRTIRLLMILATVVALAGIGAWAYAQSGVGPKAVVERKLTVRVARVDIDWEGAAAVAKEFEGTDGSEVAESAIDAASRWIVERLGEAGAMSPHDRLMVSISLPADFARENPAVVTEPPVRWEAFTAVVGGGEKSRVPVGDSDKGWRGAGTWKPDAETWVLQIAPRGHEQVGIELSAGPAPARTLKLPSPRTTVAVALSDAEGSVETASDRILLRLLSDPRIKVTRPEMLAALRTEIANAARAGRSPTEQTTLRSRLGADWVVTCSVR